MNNKKIVFITRICAGWFFLYAGLIKLINTAWTSEPYLKSAKTFSGFYEFLARPDIITWVDKINEWGLTLLGISLILGVFVKWSGWLGAVLMILYYFPVLAFPHAGNYSFIIDEHIIYALLLLWLGAAQAGKNVGLDKYLIIIRGVNKWV